MLPVYLPVYASLKNCTLDSKNSLEMVDIRSQRGLKVPCSATELPAHISPDSTSIIQRFVRPPPSPDFCRDNIRRENEQDAGSKWVAFSRPMSILFIEGTPYAELPTYTHDTYSI
jgi:hypothetical protein